MNISLLLEIFIGEARKCVGIRISSYKLSRATFSDFLSFLKTKDRWLNYLNQMLAEDIYFNDKE